MHPVLFRLPWADFPVFSYGVMLGLSFVVGWYVTLGLAGRDKLPKEMLATCYVVTAISALLMSRLLFVATNPDKFESASDIFAVRSGGMVAYGGFLGGLIGSVVYLLIRRFPLLPWADVAVPSLATGLFLTRIGCYLNGCDYGRTLGPSAPGFVTKLGTFPHWTTDVGAGQGSLAWAEHVDKGWISDQATSSLPVHPTQLYESALGLVLFLFLLWLRKRQSFRGQIFLTFAFLYGFARFGIEFLRDDSERGDIPPALPPYILYSGALLLFALAFIYAVDAVIKNKLLKTIVQIIAIFPGIYVFFKLRPGEFETAIAQQRLSTSQFIGLVSAVLAAVAFGFLYRAAQANPVGAMALPDWRDPNEEKPDFGDDDDDNAKEKETAKDKTKTKASAKPIAKKVAKTDPAPKKISKPKPKAKSEQVDPPKKVVEKAKDDGDEE